MCQMRYRLKFSVRTPGRFRKAYYLPLSPRLHAASIQLASVFKFSLPLPNILECSALRRRVPQSVLVNPFACPAFPAQRGRRLVRISLVRKHRNDRHAAREILTQINRPHIDYELSTQHRLETPLTYRPPPICTSALGSQTALVWRAVDAAND